MKIALLMLLALLEGCVFTQTRPLSQTDLSVTYCVPTPSHGDPDEMASAYCAERGLVSKAMAMQTENCRVGVSLGVTRAYECVSRPK